jgi:hypothetical protein
MTPDIRLSSKAEAKIASIPLSLLDAVENELIQLTEHPASLSEPTAFPFPPGRLMKHFRLRDFDNTRWDITVLFWRLPDENGIFIDNLVIQTHATEDEEGPAAQ